MINLHAQLDTQLYPELDPVVGSSLEYDYSVTQFPPGDYCYVKWWDGGTISRSKPRQKDEIGNTRVAHISDNPVFPDFFVFLVPKLFIFLGCGSLAVFRQRRTKNTGYTWLIPCCGLAKQPRGCLSNQC